MVVLSFQRCFAVSLMTLGSCSVVSMVFAVALVTYCSIVLYCSIVSMGFAVALAVLLFQ